MEENKTADDAAGAVPAQSGAAPGIEERARVYVKKIDGYHVYQKDATDRYWNLFQKFRRGEISHHRFNNAVKERSVYLIEDEGRRYIVKWDKGGWGFGGETRLEKIFWRLVRGPFYSRLMRRMRRARENGCDVIQDVFMVAERRTLHFCHEAIVIFEYIDGHMLVDDADRDRHIPEIVEAMHKLHQNGLAMCDVSIYNYLVTPEGIKMIDLVCRGNPRLDRIKDVIRLKRVLGVELPVDGFWDRLLYRLYTGYHSIRNRYFRRRRKRGALSRNRNYRMSKEDCEDFCLPGNQRQPEDSKGE